MRKITLGTTDTQITDYCLGTMTWGTHTPEGDAHRQMDMALDAGITIIDTAEMYPVNPVTPETVGLSETVLGNWNAQHPGRRGDYLLATKITGKNAGFVRFGQDITPATFAQALDASLVRLKTDVIDIYQIHWPNRGSYHFRQNWRYDPSAQDRAATRADMLALLEAAERAVKSGKIRHFALSNESAWGTAQWLDLARAHGLPRVQSIQNEYSLLCRLYDTDLAELAVNEAVTLLGYSPLATGLLTGKYQNGACLRAAGWRSMAIWAGARPHAPLTRYRPIWKWRPATTSTRCIWRWPSACSAPLGSRRSSGPRPATSWPISSRGST